MGQQKASIQNLDLSKVDAKSFKNQQVNLSIVSILQTELGKGDTAIISAKKSIASVISNFEDAVTISQAILPQADRYIDMAKALGEAGVQKNLENVKAEANATIKMANASIAKLKSI